MKALRELKGVDPRALPDELLLSTEPLLLRGLVASWPAAQAGARSAADAVAYLRGCGRDASVGFFVGPPQIEGRFFYNDDFSGFNFQRQIGKLGEVLDQLLTLVDEPQPPALYVGSTTVDTCLPGFGAANGLCFGEHEPLASVWLGNRSCIAAHQDLPDNLACVVAGRRRFTLLPPDQLANLYIGPLDLTPAGQPISLVDFRRPDLLRFPKFSQALQQARVVELGPGDALFIPSMWWHQVEALDSVNVLVNYWWRQSPAFMDAPIAALLLALMTVRDLPPAQREAWRAQFNHHVFDADAATAAHIPPAARGWLGPIDHTSARQLRAQLLKRLNR